MSKQVKVGILTAGGLLASDSAIGYLIDEYTRVWHRRSDHRLYRLHGH